MTHSLNSLTGGCVGYYIWDYYRVTKGDTRSLDYSTYGGTGLRSEGACRGISGFMPCVRLVGIIKAHMAKKNGI